MHLPFRPYKRLRRWLQANLNGIHRRLQGQRRRGAVDFVVAGAQKSGTSALRVTLHAHPEVRSPANETHFFDSDPLFRASANPDWDEVHAAYLRKLDLPPARALGQLVGEVTPSYLWWPPVAQRIHDYDPSIKLIVLLRNPITRAFSQWNMWVQKGWEDRPFLEAIEHETDTAMKSPKGRKPGFISRGLYLDQLKMFDRLFPAEQLLVLKHDDLNARPEETHRKIAAFLGISPSFMKHRVIHARDYRTRMDRETWDHLYDLYREEIDGLEARFGWDLSAWRRYPGKSGT